jgi:hypothetical protein
MRKSTFLLAVVATLLLAGCGGDDSGDEQASSRTTRAADPTPTTAGDTTFTGSGSSEYCQLSRSYLEKAEELQQAGGGPEALRQLYRDADRDVKRAVDVAPDEIKPDVKVVADAVSALVTALEQADYDFSRVSPNALANLSTPQFQASARRVEAYATSVCGLRP